MKALWIIAFTMLGAIAHAGQWERSLATVASLRTGGAHLVSSDALTLESGDVALITYWEVRTPDDLDVYRCVDKVDPNFVAIGHECHKALRPNGPSQPQGIR